MPTLLEVQTAMRHGLLDGGDPAARASSCRCAHARRPAQHLPQHFARHSDQRLAAQLPRCASVSSARISSRRRRTRFITTRTAPHRLARSLRRRLPGISAEFRAGRDARLPSDVARLERAVGRALHASDAGAAGDSRAWPSIDASDRARVRFAPHPSVGLLSSPYPVDAIWRAVLARDDAAQWRPSNSSAGAVHLLIERREDEVAVTRLSKPRWSVCRSAVQRRDRSRLSLDAAVIRMRRLARGAPGGRALHRLWAGRPELRVGA